VTLACFWLKRAVSSRRLDPDRSRRVEFYTHEEGWKNKLICGDSLHVIESLLQYENLRGKVQMIYMDPPYGVKYDSNFQQRVDSTSNDEESQADDVLTIKAFRDTWTLGVHSYLSYLEERLYLLRELLSETGSIFVQISDQNVHRVRALMDEVFGNVQFCGLISFVKTTGASNPAGVEVLPTVCDYLVWYAKNRERVKYFQLYKTKSAGRSFDQVFTWIELSNGERRPLTAEESNGELPLPQGSRLLARADPYVTEYELDVPNRFRRKNLSGGQEGMEDNTRRNSAFDSKEAPDR